MGRESASPLGLPPGRRQRRLSRLPAGLLDGVQDLVDGALQRLEARVVRVLELLHLVRFGLGVG